MSLESVNLASFCPLLSEECDKVLPVLKGEVVLAVAQMVADVVVNGLIGLGPGCVSRDAFLVKQ